MDLKLQDSQIRQAAFDAVSRMAFSRGGNLEAGDLRYGFVFGGERVPLINPQRGIFKPRQLGWLLSLRTVFPRSGARIWYDDQREANRQIYAGDETIEYASRALIPRPLTIGAEGSHGGADPRHLFPRQLAGKVPADHPDLCGRMGFQPSPSATRLRSAHRRIRRGDPTGCPRASLRPALNKAAPPPGHVPRRGAPSL
jgi:hypothetical protein